MGFTRQRILRIVIGGMLMSMLAVSASIWHYRANIRTKISELTPKWSAPQLVTSPQTRQVTIQQTLQVTPDRKVVPTPSATLSSPPKPVVRKTATSSTKVRALCKRDAYKDTKSCRN